MDAVVLIIKKGLYLVPGKKQKFGLIYCDGENFKKLYKNSFAKELISLISTDSDAMQIALSYVNQEPVIEKRYSPARAERIFTENRQVVKIFRSGNVTPPILSRDTGRKTARQDFSLLIASTISLTAKEKPRTNAS